MCRSRHARVPDDDLSRCEREPFIVPDPGQTQGYDTMYEVNFPKMQQINRDTKKVRNIRRKDAKGAGKASWEWWTDESDWAAFNEQDSELLEKAFGSGITPFMTKKLSFNAGFDSLYMFDFDVMTQAGFWTSEGVSFGRRAPATLGQRRKSLGVRSMAPRHTRPPMTRWDVA